MQTGNANTQKKQQIMNAFLKEFETMLSIFREIDDCVELQSMHNIFTIFKNTKSEMLMEIIYNDFSMPFKSNIIPTCDVDFFLSYDVLKHVRNVITTQHILDSMSIFSEKMQKKLKLICENNTDSDKIKNLITSVQKFVKLTLLYNK